MKRPPDVRAPDRQRYLDAVAHCPRPDVPLFETEADPAIVEGMLGKAVDYALHSFELPIADVVEWNRRMGNDMAYFSHVWHLGRKEMRDEHGRLHYVDGTMKSRAALRDFPLPDLDALRRRLEALLAALEGTEMGVVIGAQTAGFTAATAIGFQDFCIAAIENPTFVDEFQKLLHEYTLRELAMYLEYPIDAVKIGSGLIAGGGPMLGPAMMERFEFRHMREQAAMIKAAGKFLMFHIDGQVEPLLPTLLAMGGDVLHPIDPCGGQQDIYHLKEAWGDRIALHGNIDINGVLLSGTAADVRADVQRHIEGLSADGGYIVSSSHDLHQLLPLENIYAMRDAVHEHP
ncbi:MAG: uroporphyrinogen decarboxylase family protein [Planctomycetaceae bacterium]|nr:uroporphyrinogen decarboxylase family protein [Planctomycetaceae bacterium]